MDSVEYAKGRGRRIDSHFLMTPTAALLIWTSLSWNVSESAFGNGDGHGDCSNRCDRCDRYRGREVLEQGLAGGGRRHRVPVDYYRAEVL